MVRRRASAVSNHEAPDLTCGHPSRRRFAAPQQVVAMATIAPAKIINRAPKVGTLQVGAPGDVAIMELAEGPVSFVDTHNNKRDGKLLLKPVQTVVNGVPFGRPYQAPFAGGCGGF